MVEYEILLCMIQYGTCTVYDSVWCMVKQNLLGVGKGQGRVKVVKVLFVVRREINKWKCRRIPE